MTTANRHEAWQAAHENDGRLVELVEAPAKVVVSEAEAKLLKGVHGVYIYPAGESISRFVQAQYGHGSMSADQALEMEKHLMRAYVNGYTVKQDPLYNVRVHGTESGYYYKNNRDKLRCFDVQGAQKRLDKRAEFTMAEIDQYHLQYCEREEVKQDENQVD